MANDKLIKIAVIAALMIGVVLLFSSLIGYMTVYEIINYAYSRIREATGASPWLVLGVLFALLGPFVWSLKHAFSPFSKQKTAAKVALGVYVSGFCFAMFFLSKEFYFRAQRSGNEVIIQAEKCFIRTPKGVKIVECDDVDPKTGLKPEPLTPQMVEILERRKENMFPQRLSYSSAGEIEFFDTISGEVKVWYAEVEGLVELYNNFGRHPKTNVELRPVTPEIVSRVRREEAQQLAMRQEEEAKRKKEQQEQEVRRFQERYLVTGSTKNPGTTNIAVMTVDERGVPDSQLSQQIARSLTAARMSANAALFKPSFATDGLFGNVMNGEVDSIRSLSLSRYTDFVLLGRKRISYGTDQAAQQMLGTNVYTAKITIDVRIISAATRAIHSDLSVSERGAGLTREKAESEAVEMIQRRFVNMNWNL